MPKKWLKFLGGGLTMIINNIFNIFCLSTFPLGYFTNPAFWLNFKKIALKTWSRKYPREIVKKLKMLKMLLFYFGHFWPILQICSNSKNPTSAIYLKPDSDSYW